MVALMDSTASTAAKTGKNVSVALENRKAYAVPRRESRIVRRRSVALYARAVRRSGPSIQHKSESGAVVLRIGNGDELIEEADRCGIRPPHLLLDLSKITYLDQTGLETLLRTQTRLSNGFDVLEVVDLTPEVIRLLHEAHLDGASGIPPENEHHS